MTEDQQMRLEALHTAETRCRVTDEDVVWTTKKYYEFLTESK